MDFHGRRFSASDSSAALVIDTLLASARFLSPAQLARYREFHR
jgi:hypothetical protein